MGGNSSKPSEPSRYDASNKRPSFFERFSQRFKDKGIVSTQVNNNNNSNVPLPSGPREGNDASDTTKKQQAVEEYKTNANVKNDQNRGSALMDAARRSLLGKKEMPEDRPAMKISQIPELYDIDWSPQGQLGKGHYAVVFRGVTKATGELVAAKRIDRSLTRSSTLRSEVNILKKVRGHPSIVSLFDVYYDETHVVLIMEYLGGGELFDRIVENGAYSERDASMHMRKIGLALKFMHDQNIVHRDLKPENLVLLDKTPNSEIKISDFGLSKLLKDDEETMNTVCGTRAYAPAEVGFGGAPGSASYTNKVDLWSLGVILYVVLAAYHPFDPWGNASDSQIWDRICRGDWDFNDPVWDEISDDARDLITHLICSDPERRYGADELLRHPWIVQFQTMPTKPLASLSAKRSLKSFYRGGGPISALAASAMGLKPGTNKEEQKVEEEANSNETNKPATEAVKEVDKEIV